LTEISKYGAKTRLSIGEITPPLLQHPKEEAEAVIFTTVSKPGLDMTAIAGIIHQNFGV